MLIFAVMLLLSATSGKSFMTQASCKQTSISDSITCFPQTGKFYTLAGRVVDWEIVGEKNITSYDEEITRWSVHDVIGDVVYVNRMYADSYISPANGIDWMDTEDFDYVIATNRTILSVYWKCMSLAMTSSPVSGNRSIEEDVGEHTWAWFPSNLSIGINVNVSFTGDRWFLDDMLFAVIGEDAIRILDKKQDCWIVHMPPSLTKDGARVRTETYWVDKDTLIPLKIYGEAWTLSGLDGFAFEDVLVNTNIDLGPESTQLSSPTYTIPVPITPEFPDAGKFYTWYLIENSLYVSGATNVTYCDDGLFTIWVVNVTGDEAQVYRILWFEDISINATEGTEKLEAVGIQYYNYTINIKTREILKVAGCLYLIIISSLTYEKIDRTSQLAGDIGEETYYWLPKNLSMGATVNISWTRDMPIDNGTYSVIGESIISTLDKRQDCWILYMPPTLSIDKTWNYTETYYCDKDTGIILESATNGWAVDGTSADYSTLRFIGTNVDLGPQTYVFPVIADSQTFYVKIMTNSTILIETFNFSKEDVKLSYNVTGPFGTMGFCNVTIPQGLLKGPWIIKVNSKTIIPNITYTDNYTFIYFNYNHSTCPIEIFGSWVIPELLVMAILLLLIAPTLLAFTVRKKKARTIC